MSPELMRAIQQVSSDSQFLRVTVARCDPKWVQSLVLLHSIERLQNLVSDDLSAQLRKLVERSGSLHG